MTLVIAMAIAVSGTQLISPGSGIIGNVSVKNNGTGGYVVPGQTYMSHNISIEDNSTPVNHTTDHWYTNVTNFTVYINNGTIATDDIINITIYNETGSSIFGYNNTVANNDSVIITPSSTVSINATTVNFSVNITVNTTGLIDGRWLSPNVTVGTAAYNATSGTVNCTNITWANDTIKETIEVLNATAGTTYTHAYAGQNFVVVGNVTIKPGNDTVATNLTNITFNTTSETTLTAADITGFALWNDTNSDNALNVSEDLMVNSTNCISESDKNASFSGLNSTIPAGATNRYFLTMNLSSNIPSDRLYYQAKILAQNITINNGTGNSSNTSSFSILGVTTVTDSPAVVNVGPGVAYLAYNVTYAENKNDVTGANLTWFNITGWNATVPNNASLDDIANISIWNGTAGLCINYSRYPVNHTRFPINISLGNHTVSDNISINISVNITINTTGLIDGKNVSFNATLVSNETTYSLFVNDTAAETIEVLNATAGISNTTAWEGNTTVLCANVTITPGNNSVDNNLKVITFNATSGSTLDSAYIESFGLWNDSNANKIFDSASDKNIANVTPTSVNVTFDLSALPLDNRTIPAGATNGTFFLTMNITETAHIGNYTAQIFPQNITINQTADEGNTGNSTITTGFTHLWIDPVDVWVYDDPREYIGVNVTYVAYTITYYENASDATSANLTWFNVTEMNQSVSGRANINNITNVSVWNSTTEDYIGHNVTRLSTSPYFTVNLSNTQVADNSTYKLTIMLTTNTTPGLIDGKKISINASLYDNETNNLSANDPAPEIIDTIEPTVDAKSPTGTGVAITTTISATFSEAMYPATITTTTFTLNGVTGTVTYDAGTRTATFDPDADLAYSKEYTVTIGKDAQDLAGNSMDADYTWSFTTASAPVVPRRGGGGGGTTTTSTTTGETSVSTETTGEVKSTVTATSTDAKASVTISAETIAKDAAGSPLTSVTVTQPSALPAGVPSDANYVGYAYTFGPAGATFSKPVTISITFDSAKYEGKTPVIHVYEAGAWKALATTVVGNRATATVTHFSTFVLFAAEVVEVTPTPTATPTISPTVAPTATPAPTPTPKRGIPGFEAVFAIAGLLAVAYLVLRKKRY